MKRLLTGIICLIMLTMCVGTGFAVKAQYTNTQAFLDALDGISITYTVINNTDEDKTDQVKVNNKGDKCAYTINYFFDKDNTEASIRVWDLIKFKDSDLEKVTKAVNSLNYQYKYVKWYVDESDNTVTASWDIIIRENKDVVTSSPKRRFTL